MEIVRSALSPVYKQPLPSHSSVAALVHYRRVRDSAMEQQLATNTTTVEQQEVLEEEEDQFDMAYRTVFTNELENRARRVKQVAFLGAFQ